MHSILNYHFGWDLGTIQLFGLILTHKVVVCKKYKYVNSTMTVVPTMPVDYSRICTILRISLSIGASLLDRWFCNFYVYFTVTRYCNMYLFSPRVLFTQSLRKLNTEDNFFPSWTNRGHFFIFLSFPFFYVRTQKTNIQVMWRWRLTTGVNLNHCM